MIAPLPIGASRFEWRDDACDGRPVVVHCYKGRGFAPDRPLVVVQHGMLRNGEDYCSFWHEAAERHDLLIVAPTFSNEAFSGPERYNNGCVRDEAGNITPAHQWLYGIPDNIVAALAKVGETAGGRVLFYGHSAGGQFGHRMLATGHGTVFEQVIVGNPGWYTLPDAEKPFPEGFGDLPLDDKAVARFLAAPLVIFAGDRDIDMADPNLPGGKEALAQGPHRFARAQNMMRSGEKAAARLNMPLQWQIITIAGVGHDGAAMSRAAAMWWFENRIATGKEIGVTDAPTL